MNNFYIAGKPIKYYFSKLLRGERELATLDVNSALINKDINWSCVYKGTSLDRNKPVNYGIKEVLFNSYPKTDIPELGVFSIPNGLVNCSNGWIMDSENKLLTEATWYAGFSNELKGQKKSFPKFPQRVRGTILTLLSDFSVNNYGHLLLDSLSRYHLYLAAGFTDSDVDHILVPGKPNKRMIDWTNKMGIPSTKLLWSSHFDFLKTDTLIATSFPGLRRSYLPFTIEFLQKKFGNYEKEPSRKLYLQRTGRRKISNEIELLPILEEFGFEIYRPELSTNSIEDFCNATAIIGGHGAGLTDIAFCRKGTPVLELMPSDHMYEYFYTLADAAKLTYGYVVCESNEVRDLGSLGPSFSDYYVEPDLFRKALKVHFGSKLIN